MKKSTLVIVLLVSLVVAGSLLLSASSVNSSSLRDPCDAYGDCISSSITYTRANPDNTLYPGDQFGVSLKIALASGSSESTSWLGSLTGVAWSYDTSEFSADTTEAMGQFLVSGNTTGSYTVHATATFLVTITTCSTSNGVTTCSTSYLATSLIVSETVTVIQLQLRLSYRIQNVTDRATIYVLRNPDGSFYHNDSFCVQWNASFQFSDRRTDINVSAHSVPLSSLVLANSSVSDAKSAATASDVRAGRFCYRISLTAAYQPYNLTLDFKPVNWLGKSMAHRTLTVPFAVVDYSPYFKYFTYMLYNSREPSTYQRPFVTLVRYGGNNPGYAYGGDSNTFRITAVNDTRERAWINNFTFSTEGWTMDFTLRSPDVGNDVNFTGYPRLNMSMTPLMNSSSSSEPPMITWNDRIEKYYFRANQSEIAGYVNEGMTYFNLTERDYSLNFAGGTYSLFNTTYTYEPVYYDGYLVLRAYNSTGAPDPSVNVTVSAGSPSPLNQHLLASVEDVFGNDSAIIRAFESDLYPAYNATRVLKPTTNSSGVWIYMLNETNFASSNAAEMPYFFITVSGHGRTYAYDVSDTFSGFLLDNDTLPALPFRNATVYYLDPTRQLIAEPLEFNFSGYMPFLEWDYNDTSLPSFFSPVSYEPGNLTTTYPLLLGHNTTIFVNLDGGGMVAMPFQSGYAVNVQLLVGADSGGVTAVWAEGSGGNLLGNYTVTPNSLPPSPSGFTGLYSAAFYPSGNGTISIWVRNSWGVDSEIGNIPVTIHPPPSTPFPTEFLWLFAMIILLFYAIGRATHTQKRFMSLLCLGSKEVYQVLYQICFVSVLK